MGSADEVSFMYALYGTYFPTLAAGNTLVVVYSGKIVYYLDCIYGTVLFTLSAGYTTVLTELANLCALVVIVTLNDNSGYVVHEMDYTVGAGLFTKAASNTFLGIYLRYAALRDGNRITGANLGAVTVSETGEGAEAVTSKAHICRLAGRRAAIDILSLLGKTSTVTSNVSHLLNDLFRLDAEDRGDLSCGTVTAGSTKIRFVGHALAESLCITVTSGKTASAAICAGKTFTDTVCFFVLFNTEKLCRNGKKNRAQNTNAEKKEDGN